MGEQRFDIALDNAGGYLRLPVFPLAVLSLLPAGANAQPATEVRRAMP
jgi:hypothetical protein